MDIKQALNNINQFKQAIELIQKEYSSYFFDKKRYDDLVAKDKKQKQELFELKHHNSVLKLHLSKFKSLSKEHDICNNCNGEGGFSWDTGQGIEGEQCELCEGTGIIEKSQIFDIKESENKCDDNNELPF